MNKKGISGIKIITVLAVTALWISIALPSVFNFNIQSNEAQALNQMQKLTDACEKFKAQNGKYPENLQALSKMLKEGLTSPGYHFQYEFLTEGNFVLVALPNNNFSGKNGYYSDNDGTSIVIPEVGIGKEPGEGKPMIIDSTFEKIVSKIRNKGKIQTAISVMRAVNNYSNMENKVDTRSEFIDLTHSYVRGEVGVCKEDPKKEEVLPEQPKKAAIAMIPETPKLSLPDSFENLVAMLESVSATPTNSVNLAKNDAKTTKDLTGIDKSRDLSLLKESRINTPREADTPVVTGVPAAGNSDNSGGSSDTEDTSLREKIRSHKK